MTHSTEPLHIVGNEPPVHRGVKFDATINLGHLLTFAGFLITGASVWQTLDKRVVVLEQARIAQTETDRRHDAERIEMKQTMREDLREINGKLDRLIESKK